MLKEKKKIILVVVPLGGVVSSLVLMLGLSWFRPHPLQFEQVSRYKKDQISVLINSDRYKCCLTKPCSYCFLKNGHKREGLVCDCLEEVVNGEAPCGECLGEILEGEGNPFLSEYFAPALAEEMEGVSLELLQQFIKLKYQTADDRV